MLKLGMEEGQPVEGKFITRRIRAAQSKLQRGSYARRLEVVELDDITARHRMIFYNIRQKVLTRQDVRPELLTMLDNWVDSRQREGLPRAMERLRPGDERLALGRVGEFLERLDLEHICRIRDRKRQARTLRETLKRKLQPALEPGTEALSLLKSIILRCLDHEWSSYLGFEEAAREEIGLYSFEDPKALAQYAQRMEQRFDSFFHDVGEQVLANTLWSLGSFIPNAPSGSQEPLP